MRFSANKPPDLKLALLAALAIIALAGPAIAADGISVEDVNGRFENGMYVVKSRVAFDLTGDMREAINNGIDLSYDVEIEIYARRRWLWDYLIVRSVQRIDIAYHALTATYIVTNETTRNKENFATLDEALGALGRLNRIVVSEQKYLPGPAAYQGRIRIKLDVNALPAPLRPIAYLSPDWDLRSDWQFWEVTP